MRSNLKVIYVSFVLSMAVTIDTAKSATVEPFLNDACPEAWSQGSKTIPVVSDLNEFWSDGKDKERGRSHIRDEAIIETIDAVPVTLDHKVSDALTVASECLFYRNLLADGKQFFPKPGVVERKKRNGWISASAF